MASYNYADLLQTLINNQATMKGPVQAWQGSGQDAYLATLNPTDPGYAQAAGAWEWNNGFTGNQGVNYSYDPSTNSFVVAQGDATSGIQRYRVSENGQEDMGFEDIDRNGKFNQGLGTMAAIAAAVVGGGALLEAYAPSLSTAGQAALGTSGATSGAGSSAALAAAENRILGSTVGMQPGTAASYLAGTGAAHAAGGLTVEGILGSNFATNPAAVGATGLGDAAMYGAPATLAGGSAAMQGLPNTGPIDTGLSGNLGVPTGGTPGVSSPLPTGATPRPGGQQSGQQGNSVLENLLGGTAGGADLARLIAGLIGSNQQRNFGQDLLQRANDATPNRTFYEGQLRQSYENPASYLQGPEFQAIQDITHNKLQRSDAAGGRLANDYGRQVGLQNQAYQSLDGYRRTLSGITGQNQQTYSGQNSMFMQGAQADNSWMNGILNSLLSRPQQSSGTTPGTVQTQDGRVVNGTYRTGAELASGIGSWFGGTDFNRSYNLDAIA